MSIPLTIMGAQTIIFTRCSFSKYFSPKSGEISTSSKSDTLYKLSPLVFVVKMFMQYFIAVSVLIVQRTYPSGAKKNKAAAEGRVLLHDVVFLLMEKKSAKELDVNNTGCNLTPNIQILKQGLVIHYGLRVPIDF